MRFITMRLIAQPPCLCTIVGARGGDSKSSAFTVANKSSHRRTASVTLTASLLAAPLSGRMSR